MPAATPWTVSCDSCGAEIFWAVNTTTRKRNPIDAEPRTDGNVIVHGNPRSLTERLGLTCTTVGPLEAQLHDGELFVSHFATCPDAESWRGQTRPRRNETIKEHA